MADQNTVVGKQRAAHGAGGARRYIVAILAAVLALLLRAALDPLLGGDHALVLPLVAVVFVAWYAGLGPALTTLFLSVGAVDYFFIHPRGSFGANNFSDRLAVGSFLFAGLICALLGEAQRRARWRAESHLADSLASESRKTAIVTTALDAVITMDAAGRVVEFNPAAEQMFGHAREKAIGRDLAELIIPPRWRAAHRQGLARYLAGGAGTILNRRVELTALRADGTEFPVELSVTPIRTGGLPLFTSYLRDIGDRRRGEEALRASEERLRFILGSMPQMIFTARADGTVDYLNPQWVEYTGLSFDELRDWGWMQSVHPNDVAETGRAWQHALDTGEPYRFEQRLRGADGAYRWHLSRATPQRDAAGRIVMWIGVNTDIDDARRLRDELRASEERYRFLAETLPALVWSSTPEGHRDYHNHRWEEYTGLPAEASGGDGWVNCLHPDDRPRSLERWQRALDTGTKYQTEHRLRRADGVYRWFLAQAVPMWGADGEVLRWFGTATDIDDQKRLQHELRHSLDRFRALTEAMPQLVWTTDPTGRVDYLNKRWMEYTGLTLEQAQAEAGQSVIHPDDLEQVNKVWVEAVAGGADQFVAEYRLRRAADGLYRWHLASGMPVRDEHGGVLLWVGAATDIDAQKRQAETLERLVAARTTALRQEVEERRRAEELLRATGAELERSNGELEQFAYVASHDLQEPLRKIQAFGDRLKIKNGDHLGDQGKDYLDRMLSSAARMSQLINDLLTFSRVTTKSQPFAPADLSAVAAGVLSDLEVRITQTGGAVDVGPLPTIDADPLQMRQLLQNLIANALKFHRAGVPPVVTVRGEVQQTGGRPTCRLTISDNGIGFDEKYLDRIFQVFQRLHGRYEYEGTGVGLAICRKIVERHGGEITATSVPDQGATFIITLPVHQPK
jgi:PAS domain S-box-containing protein